jgi:hypothetical protein
MITRHVGRIGKEQEYIEYRIDKPKLNVVAQKSRSLWFYYLIKPGRNGVTLPVDMQTPFEDRISADRISEAIAKGIKKYSEM